MASPKIYSCDLSKLTFTASLAADAAYPLTNLLTYFEDKLWKSSASTNAQTLNIQATTVALGSVNKTFVVVGSHNFASMVDLGGRIRIQYAADAGFTTGVTTVYDTDIDTTESPLVIDFASTTRAYWRILYDNTGGVIPQVGNFFLGNSFDFAYNYELPFKPLHYGGQTTEMTALDGRIRTSQAFGMRKFWEFEFKLMSDTVLANFNLVMRTIRGKLRPFYLQDYDGTVTCVMLDADRLPPTQIYNQLNNLEKLPLRSPLVT